MNWQEFKEAASDMAADAERLFNQSGFVFVGTVRRDGSPRISPVEALITDGKLYLGMMRESLKSADLLRDPRCTVHSSVKDSQASDGEFKLHGKAIEINDADERQRYCAALFKKIGFDASPFRFHLFWIDIDSAGLFMPADPERNFSRFRKGEPIKRFSQNVEGRRTPLD
jgi:hypothetical protein